MSGVVGQVMILLYSRQHDGWQMSCSVKPEAELLLKQLEYVTHSIIVITSLM